MPSSRSPGQRVRAASILMRSRKPYPASLVLLLGLLIARFGVAINPQQQRISALKNTRRLPIKEPEAGVEVWNAAAVNHPDLGWVALGTVSKCFWHECTPFAAGMRPWVTFMGSGLTPEIPKWARAGRQWDLAPDSLVAPFKTCGMGPETEYLIADFRCGNAAWSALTG